MRQLIDPIANYFASVNYPLLGRSVKEVLWLSGIAFLPLILSILLQGIILNSLCQAWKAIIVPGEIVAFSLSFIAPTLYLVIKTHGKNYRLPMLEVVFITTIGIYLVTAVLYVIAKNGWISEIDMNPHKDDLYYKLSMIFFSVTYVIWIYSTYHLENFSDYSQTLRQGQQSFNQTFRNSINPESQ